MIALKKKTVTASMDVDPQCTFTEICPEELPVKGGAEIADELNQQAKKAIIRVVSRDAHNPNAVWVADNNKHKQFDPIGGNNPNVDIYWRSHAMVGTRGFELIPGLSISEYDYQVLKGIEVDKHPYGACYHDFAEKESTGVIEYLKHNKVNRVIVGGLATDYCVKHTVLQLLRAGFQVIVNLGACRGISPETVEQAKLEMKEAGAVFVNNASDIKE